MIKYNKIDPAVLNGNDSAIIVLNYEKINNYTIRIPIVCQFLYTDELALENTNFIEFIKGKAPRIVDFKGDIKLATTWIKTDETICSLKLNNEHVKILIDAWNEYCPDWMIRRDCFISSCSLSDFINLINNIINYNTLSLLASELGWIKCLSKPINNDTLIDSNKKIHLSKTNVIEMLNWPSGFIKLIKSSELNLKLSESAFMLYERGYNLNFIKSFMENFKKIDNSKKIIELILNCYNLYSDTNILQNRILTMFKDNDPYDYLTMLHDYLRMASDLNIEIRGKEIARGGELIIENDIKSSKMKMHHDNMSREFSLAKDKILTTKFIDVNEAYKRHVEFNIKISEDTPENEIPEYIFILPKSPFDLEEEGRVLGHCVGSYSKSVSNDACLIVLMRERKCPHQPLLTIELYNNSNKVAINQVQGKSRRRPTDKENTEINRWLHHLNSKNFRIKKSEYYKELNKELDNELENNKNRKV